MGVPWGRQPAGCRCITDSEGCLCRWGWEERAQPLGPVALRTAPTQQSWPHRASRAVSLAPCRGVCSCYMAGTDSDCTLHTCPVAARSYQPHVSHPEVRCSAGFVCFTFTDRPGMPVPVVWCQEGLYRTARPACGGTGAAVPCHGGAFFMQGPPAKATCPLLSTARSRGVGPVLMVAEQPRQVPPATAHGAGATGGLQCRWSCP